MSTEVRLAEILGALSRALDLTEGQPPGHCVRCCWIGVSIGRQLGLPEAQLKDLYYALLLKDLGCSSNAARICELYLADDLSFKKDFKLVEWQPAAGAALRAVAHGRQHRPCAALPQHHRNPAEWRRARPRTDRDALPARCRDRAQMRFSEAVASAILDLDEHWDGGGKPVGTSPARTSRSSRASRSWRRSSTCSTPAPDAPTAAPRCGNRAGGWFDPAIVAAFEQVLPSPTTSGRRSSATTSRRMVLEMEPGQQAMLADDDYLDDIAAGLRPGDRREEPVHLGPQRTRRRLHRPDRRGNGLRPSAPALAEARRAPARHRQARRQQQRARQARKARRRRMGRDAAPRRTVGTDPVADRGLRAICRRSPAPITKGSTARAIHAACGPRRSTSTPASSRPPTSSTR